MESRRGRSKEGGMVGLQSSRGGKGVQSNGGEGGER